MTLSVRMGALPVLRRVRAWTHAMRCFPRAAAHCWTRLNCQVGTFDMLATGAGARARAPAVLQVCAFDTLWGGLPVPMVVWSGVVDGLPVYFVEPSNGMFWRGSFYGEADDLQRFLFFSRCVLTPAAGCGGLAVIMHSVPRCLLAATTAGCYHRGRSLIYI